LLEEAKGEFINVQLRQQEKIEKEEREKREYQKRNKLLKTQLKNYKKDTNSNDTTICDPNRSLRANSTFTVTPFRINSKHSRLSGSDEP
jgi:cell division protein FtsB